MAAIRGAQVLYNSSLQFAASIPYGAGIVGAQYQNGVLVGGTPAAWLTGSSSIPVSWCGGRTMVSIDSDTVFPPTAEGLCVQVQNQRGAWLQAGSGALLAGTVSAYMGVFDAGPGMYRVFSGSGLTTGLNVILTGISYGT